MKQYRSQKYHFHLTAVRLITMSCCTHHHVSDDGVLALEDLQRAAEDAELCPQLADLEPLLLVDGRLAAQLVHVLLEVVPAYRAVRAALLLQLSPLLLSMASRGVSLSVSH